MAASVARQRVPTPLSRFFGRADETRMVRALLDGSRLVTVVGPPGSGKTRLGIEVGADLHTRFRDGACFVDLTSVSDGASVPAAVASALGIAERPGCTVADTVVDALATAELLLILDNCEHLVRATASMTGALLSGCGDVRVLATSRIALGITGEQLFRVPPLDREPSVALFADRARLVGPTVRNDDRHIERICHRLDGLPLAIELAAAWSRVLSPAQVLHRLEAMLPMLGNSADPASRQRTMDATVGWSYRLLTPAQQALFDQLSVFVGGFDLAAAEAVANRGMLDDLTALVDHSLVLAEGSGSGMRYRLLEPIRQYGAAALAERDDARARARSRHADHYLSLAQHGDAGLRRADLSRHLLELRSEEGNLLAALAWASDDDPETALRIATALAYFWEQCGAVNDGRARLTALLDRGVGDSALRATALARLGRLAWRQRDIDAARAHYAESLAIMRGLGNPRGIARGLRNLALTECAAGNTTTAADLCEQSLRLLADHEDGGTGRGWTWMVLALTKFADGDWPGGKHCCQLVLDANRAERSAALEATAHLGVAFAAANTGDTTTHRRHLTAVLADLRDALRYVDDPDWLWAANGLAFNEGRTRAALRLAGAARAVHGRGNHMADVLMIFSDAAVGRARREVGARAADRFMAEGAAMTTEQLTAEALERPTDADRPLSAREREVADLVGDGLTNEQVATRLVLSRRTVESHVERIKRKLELSGRNEIMAWVIGRRLEDEQESGSLRIPAPTTRGHA